MALYSEFESQPEMEDMENFFSLFADTFSFKFQRERKRERERVVGVKYRFLIASALRDLGKMGMTSFRRGSEYR